MHLNVFEFGYVKVLILAVIKIKKFNYYLILVNSDINRCHSPMKKFKYHQKYFLNLFYGMVIFWIIQVTKNVMCR